MPFKYGISLQFTGVYYRVAQRPKTWLSLTEKVALIHRTSGSIRTEIFRFKSMARIGEPLIITAQITKQTSRTVEIAVQMKRRDGSMVCEGSSVQFIVHARDNDTESSAPE